MFIAPADVVSTAPRLLKPCPPVGAQASSGGGNCFDNALKLVHDHRLATREQTQQEITGYIETLNNQLTSGGHRHVLTIRLLPLSRSISVWTTWLVQPLASKGFDRPQSGKSLPWPSFDCSRLGADRATVGFV
jgi:hypothetical protein